MYYDKSKNIKLGNGQMLIVRRAVHEDAVSLIEFLNLVGGESDNLSFGAGDIDMTIEQESSYIDNINSNENALMLVGEANGEIVCIAQIEGAGRFRTAHISDISISVRKSHWRLGIGRAVMRELIDFARQHDTIETINLGVMAENTGAIRLYEQLGFKKIGTHKNFFKVGEKYYDEILMELHFKEN